MEITTIISMVTLLVTLILGELAKKYEFIKKYNIPMQNICIGILVAIIEFIFTKDFKLSIALSGVAGGGVYDLFHNIQKIINKESE